MRFVVIGTAGHIDHGKSALVTALAGTDPDRLEEEKRRGMTIDLGFAHLDLPGGRRAGIVDVPGHERLIRTMVAGAAGVDAVLFVVAADESVMPQTREHLDILRFLGIRRGVIALTKIDLVADPEWLDLVRADVVALARGTFLEDAPVVPVSARTREGLQDLVRALDAATAGLPPRDAAAPARLPVDRSFTMPGFGTVVTGTLWTGRVRAGDVLAVLPGAREVRVRGVQSHGEAVDEARAGQRTALNLAGIAKDEIDRGDVLATPGAFEPTTLLDVRLETLPRGAAVTHLMRVRAYLGAQEVIGRVALLAGERIAAGEGAYAQLRLERPTVAVRGDAFVLRRFAPLETLGGGRVVLPHAPRRRRGAAAVAEVAALDASRFDELVQRALLAAGTAGATADELARRLASAPARVEEEARRAGAVAIRGRFFHGAAVEALQRRIAEALAAHHRGHRWRVGMPREDLKGQVFPAGDDRLFAHALEAMTAEVAVRGGLVALASHAPALTGDEQRARADLARAFLDARFAPPAAAEAIAASGRGEVAARMIQSLTDEGVLVEVDDGMLFHRDVLGEIRRVLVEQIAATGEATVASLRDRLGSSRRYTLALMEYFDRARVTRRVGDRRVLA